MAQNNEPALLTDNPLVKKFYDNTQSNIIRINDDKLKVILYENKETITKNSNYLAPLTLLISLFLTFCTTDFKEFAKIPAKSWQGFYLFFGVVSLIWLAIELKNIKKVITIDELINKIKNQTNASQSNTQGNG
jgi:hypothetical protein